MAMAKLMILCALCVLPVLVSARHAVQTRSNFIVQGRVYCDTCRCGFETTATTYISGARVKVECRARTSGKITYSVDGSTDWSGTYKIPVLGDHTNEICESVIVSSPQNGCASALPGRERARVMLSSNNGIVSNTRFANSMGFQKDSALPECAQLLKQYQEYDDQV